MNQTSGGNAWQAMRVTMAVAVCLTGCSGGGPPGSGAGSATMMKRQTEAATAARKRSAKTTRPEARPGAAKPTSATAAKVDEAAPATNKAEKPASDTAVSATSAPAKAKELHPNEPSRQTALSPDGSLAAIDGPDGSVQLFDAKSGSGLAAWPGQGSKRSALAIDSDNHHVAAGSDDGAIALLRYGNKRQEGLDFFARLREDEFDPLLRGHIGRVNAVGFARNCQHVVSAGEDTTVRVWRVSSDAPLAIAVGESACAPAIGFDGKKIAVATADHSVEMIELDDARRSRQLQHHKAPISAVAFGQAKDFKVLVSADEKGRIHVWDFGTERDQEFVGHAAKVTALACDETRRRIVSAASDGSLRIASYPTSQSQLLAQLPEPPLSLALTGDQQYAALRIGPASMSLVALSGDAETQSFTLRGESFTASAVARDGEVVLTGTAAGSVVAQSRQDGTTVAELTGAGGAVQLLAVHPDGKRFAYSGDDGVIRIGRLPEAESDHPAEKGPVAIDAHSGAVRSLAFTADGQGLISAGADNMVRLWDLENRSELESFSTLGVEPTAVCGTRKGSAIVVACGKKTVLIWSRETRKPATKLPVRGEVRSLALSPTGMLAISMADGDIQLWDIERQLEIERLTGHSGPVDHLAFSSDTRLVSAGADKTVRLWSLSPTHVIQAHRGSVRSVAVSQESGRIVTGGEDRRLCLWSPDGELLRDDDLHVRITRLAVHPRRPQVAVVTDDSFKGKEVTRWNLDEAAAMAPLPTPSAIQALAYSSDGKKLAVAGADATVRVFDSQGGMLLEEISVATNWTAVCFGAGDEHLIGTDADNVIRSYPLRLHRYFVLSSPATCAVLSPDGEFLLSGARDGDVRLWSLHSSLLRHQMATHTKPISAVSFSGDGKTAFAADLGGTVNVYSLKGGSSGSGQSPDQPIAPDKVLSDHPGAVRCLEASTSGATLISGCDDGVVRMWDVTEEKTKESYAGQGSPVVGVRLMDIGRSLLSCNGSGILNLWKRPTEAQIAKGASGKLAVTDAKSIDLTVSTAPPAKAGANAQPLSKVAAMEDRLRTARMPAERDVWRKKIEADAEAPPKAADGAFVSAKLIPRGHVPLSEIGKGEPWDLSPAAELTTNFAFDGTSNLQIVMALSTDGNLVAAATKSDGRAGIGRVCIWDVATGTELRRWDSIRTRRWHALSFAGSNDAFVYTLPDVTAFELPTGKASHFADDCLGVPMPNRDQVLFGHSTSPVAAAPLLMLVDGGRFNKEWSGRMGYETLVTALACSRDGRWAAVGVRERLRHKLVLFDLRELRDSVVLDEAPHNKPWSTEGPIGISDAAFSPDGKRLFWHGQYGTDDFRASTAVATPDGFTVSDKSVTKLKKVIVTNHVVGYVKGAPDSLYLGAKTGLVLCESKSGKVMCEINLAEPHGVKSAKDETKEGEAKGAAEVEGDLPASRVKYVVSADGAWMASADDGGKVVLWDLTTPKRPCNTFAAHTGPVVGLQFSYDNHWLVTAGEENRVRLWDLTELQDRRHRPPTRKAARP